MGKYYAVVGGRGGSTVFSGEWDGSNGCRSLVDGVPGAYCKGFASAEAANQYLSQKSGHSSYGHSTSHHSAPASGHAYSTSHHSAPASGHGYSTSHHSAPASGHAYSTSHHSAPASVTSAHPATSHSTSRVHATSQYSPSAATKYEVVHVDGACSKNGQRDATGAATSAGGYGVFFGHGDKRNVSAPLSASEPQTNNRGELRGAIAALRSVPASQPLEIRTDSSYVVKGATDWVNSWAEKGWKRPGGQEVRNLDLWKELHGLVHNRPGGSKTGVRFVHVPGHAGVEGNEAADALAVRGAKRRRTE